MDFNDSEDLHSLFNNPRVEAREKIKLMFLMNNLLRACEDAKRSISYLIEIIWLSQYFLSSRKSSISLVTIKWIMINIEKIMRAIRHHQSDIYEMVNEMDLLRGDEEERSEK